MIIADNRPEWRCVERHSAKVVYPFDDEPNAFMPIEIGRQMKSPLIANPAAKFGAQRRSPIGRNLDAPARRQRFNTLAADTPFADRNASQRPVFPRSA